MRSFGIWGLSEVAKLLSIPKNERHSKSTASRFLRIEGQIETHKTMQREMIG